MAQAVSNADSKSTAANKIRAILVMFHLNERQMTSSESHAKTQSAQRRKEFLALRS
jgi:hypothetical protein